MNQDNEDKNVIAGFFEKIPFTRQTQREIAEWVPEIAYRENTSVKNILDGEDISAILQSEKLNNPQKSQKIRDELYKKRFPLYSQMQTKWKKTAAAVNPNPSKVQFIPSPGFEKKRLEIKVTVETGDEAGKIFSSLARIDASKWDEIIFPKD
ncbi:MAG: hypothetical protein LBB56_06120 [Chitinispirillales bacterium]|jgi:hypothetical protein|nr:hypothetical protein [Chitinispirillales bacterium]